jgi:hypothetical protein
MPTRLLYNLQDEPLPARLQHAPKFGEEPAPILHSVLTLRPESTRVIAESHVALANTLANCGGLTLVLLQVGQPELGHSKHIGLETLPNQIAIDAKTCKMCPVLERNGSNLNTEFSAIPCRNQ